MTSTHDPAGPGPGTRPPHDPVPGRGPRRIDDERRWQRARWGALVLLAGSLLCAVVLGTHPATYDDLVAGLRAGRVERVTVVDAMGGAGGLVHGESGSVVAELRWRDGGLDRAARVLQVTDDVDVSAVDASGTSATIVGRVDAPLRAARPGVALSWRADRGAHVSVGPWRLDGWWWALGPAATVVLTLVLVAVGPEPALATRPAWLLLAIAGWGVPAYLLVGASRRLRARGTGRRLTGWWALPVVIVGFPVVEAAASALARAAGW